MSTPEPSGRFGRWAIRIQSGAFKIVYREDRLNYVADALLRAPLPDVETPIDDYVESKEVTKYWPEWDGNESCLKRIKAHSSYLCNCDVQFRHPNDPVVSTSAKPIVSLGEGEGGIDSNDRPVTTLYSALTDLLDEMSKEKKTLALPRTSLRKQNVFYWIPACVIMQKEETNIR
uniref:Uncharacterized protein n=1 Tax=Strigamia maritima TaxID=126957 RepID=T1IN49_STRMM